MKYSWRVRFALWIAPELKIEMARRAEQARLMSYLEQGMGIKDEKQNRTREDHTKGRN